MKLAVLGILFGSLGMAIGLISTGNYFTAITGLLAIGFGTIGIVGSRKDEKI